MRLFLDTAKLDEVRQGVAWGVISGVTTNPSLIAQAGHRDVKAAVCEIASLVDGPVSMEVVATDVEGMLLEAREYATWAPNIVVKLPTIPAGLQAAAQLAKEGIAVNMTLCFSVNQALLVAQCRATFVSPFVGRLDDVGHDGMKIVEEIVKIYRAYNVPTQVLAASLRHPLHCIAAAKAGAHAATMPFRVLEQMVQHPLTEIGLERFLADWRSRSV